MGLHCTDLPLHVPVPVPVPVRDAGSYHQHVDGHIEDDVSLFVVPLRNSASGDGIGVITIAFPGEQTLNTQQRRAAEVVGIIASLTFSWCALVGDVR